MIHRPLISLALFLLMVQSGWALPEQLNVGIHQDQSPLEFVSQEGQVQGALPELWEIWGEDYGVHVNLIEGSEKKLRELLNNGNIDILANATPMPERYFSTPYYTHDFYLFSLKTFRLEGANQLPLRLGVLQRDADFIDQQLLGNGQVVRFSTYPDMISSLKQREIDAIVANDTNLLYAIHNTDLLLLHYPDTPVLKLQIRAATLPANAARLEQIDKELQLVAQEHRQALAAKWTPSTIGYRIPWLLIGISLVIILFATLIFAIWLINTNLRRQVFNATRSLIREKEALSRAKNAALTRQNTINILFDAVQSCLFSLDRNGEISHMNQRAKNLAILNEDSEAQELSDVFPFLVEFEERLLEALRKQQPINFKRQKVTLPDSSIILADIRLKPINIEGEPQALVLIDDVTRSSLEEELLLQSQKLEIINNLAGGVAHDFNNVLGVISGSINMLKLKISKAAILPIDNFNKYVDNIFNAIEKGAVTTKSLAALGGQISVDFSNFSLNSAVNNTINNCRATLDQSVSIHHKVPQNTYMIHGNQGLLEQALLNILTNAFHAMTSMRGPGSRQGGTLSLTIEPGPPPLRHQQQSLALGKTSIDYCMLHIQDEGVGFSAEQLSQAFTPFYTTKDKGSNTGLGLTMVQNTINHHQGQVFIESKQGVGTDVFIYLPIIEAEAEAQERKKRATVSNIFVPATGCRVLLADDNPALCQVLSAGLESNGYHVTCVENGAELLATYRSNPKAVDIVITDLEMPIMNGDTAFFEIRKIDPEAKVVMTSGYLEDKRVQKVLQAGANGFIAKPCNLETLFEKVQSCLGAPPKA
jgi:signal transduction histidine kinase